MHVFSKLCVTFFHFSEFNEPACFNFTFLSLYFLDFVFRRLAGLRALIL